MIKIQPLQNGTSLVTIRLDATRTDIAEWAETELTVRVVKVPADSRGGSREVELTFRQDGAKRAPEYRIYAERWGSEELTELARTFAWLAHERLVCDVEGEDETVEPAQEASR